MANLTGEALVQEVERLRAELEATKAQMAERGRVTVEHVTGTSANGKFDGITFEGRGKPKYLPIGYALALVSQAGLLDQFARECHKLARNVDKGRK